MTAKEIKSINKEISRLRAKMIRIKNNATNTATVLSDMPGVHNVSDKVGSSVAEITDIQREIQNLEILRNSALNRLSRDIFEENCLFMKLSLHYSWTKISVETGAINSSDNIRMKCKDYFW